MIPCPACNSPQPDNAAFCAQCGHRTAPAGVVPASAAASAPAAPPAVVPTAPASPNAMRICGRCGTILPLEAAGCKVCDAPVASPAYAEPRPDGVMFAEVLESDFQCRSCGLRSALDTFWFEAEVDCSRCGTTQAFDVSQWEESLKHAHAVADLSGPPPAGQGSLRHGQGVLGDNPFKDLGVKFTFAELTQSGMTISAAGTTHRTLRVKVRDRAPRVPVRARAGRGLSRR